MESKKILILAVVGMPGSGKSEVLKTLVSDFNFTHLYYGDITFEEMSRRGLVINESNERLVREDLRAKSGIAVYSQMMLPKIEEAIKNGSTRIILESMYNVQEYEVIKKVYGESFKVLAIHSDHDVRVKRLNNRKIRPLTSEELLSREVSEAKNLWKGTLIAMADYHFLNNGTDMDSYKNELKDLINKKLGL